MCKKIEVRGEQYFFYKDFEEILSYFFAIFLLPVLPDDVVCYIAGLSKIPIRTLMLISLVGRLPGYLVAAFVNAGLAESNYTLVIVVSFLFVLLSVVGYVKRKDIEKFSRRLIQRSPRA